MPEESKDREAAFKRNARHRRRVRNQILAYMVSALFVLLVIVLVIIIAHSISKSFESRKAEREALAEAAQAEAAREEADEEPEEPLREPEEAVEEPVTEDALMDEIVSGILNEMTAEEKVLGLLVTTPEVFTNTKTVTQAGDKTREMLGSYPVGGMIYSDTNVKDEEQFHEMLSITMGNSRTPMFMLFSGKMDKLKQDITSYGINSGFVDAEKYTAGDDFEFSVMDGLLEGGDNVPVKVAHVKPGEEGLLQAVRDALNGGFDMVFIDSAFRETADALKADIEADDELVKQAEKAQDRILRLKYRIRLSS